MAPITPTPRGGWWYLIRRVPARYASIDKRGIVKISTRIRVADDPKAIRGAAIAAQLNRDLEQEWIDKTAGRASLPRRRYDDALTVPAPTLPAPELAGMSGPEVLAWFMDHLGRQFAQAAPQAATVEDRPAIMLSALLTEFEALNRAALAQMSESQKRKWRNNRQRAVNNVVAVIGDKALTAVTRDDALKFRDRLQDRIEEGEITISTANKEINSVSAMWCAIEDAKRLGLQPHFQRLSIAGEKTRVRPAYTPEFIQTKILAPGALDGLDPEARNVVLVMTETGLRPSEIVNLTPETIHLDAPVPHVEIKPDGRVLKADASLRKIPLVGVALSAMKEQSHGFPRYRDKSGGRLSIDINEHLTSAGLRETPEHSLYSLRHAMEDRITALGDVMDKALAAIMGHAYAKQKYGSGVSLEHMQSILNRIAFKPPAVALHMVA